MQKSKASWFLHMGVIKAPICNNASISFEYTGNDRRQWINMEVTSQGEMWWDFEKDSAGLDYVRINKNL